MKQKSCGFLAVCATCAFFCTSEGLAEGTHALHFRPYIGVHAGTILNTTKIDQLSFTEKIYFVMAPFSLECECIINKKKRSASFAGGVHLGIEGLGKNLFWCVEARITPTRAKEYFPFDVLGKGGITLKDRTNGHIFSLLKALSDASFLIGGIINKKVKVFMRVGIALGLYEIRLVHDPVEKKEYSAPRPEYHDLRHSEMRTGFLIGPGVRISAGDSVDIGAEYSFSFFPRNQRNIATGSYVYNHNFGQPQITRTAAAGEYSAHVFLLSITYRPKAWLP